MAEAIRVNSVAKGYDPRDFALVAYGGAGATFAVEVARQLAIPKVIVPLHPGVGAAAGLLSSDVRIERQATVWTRLEDSNLEGLQQLFDTFRSLENEVRSQLADDRVPENEIGTQLWAECRYLGQGYELMVQVPELPDTSLAVASSADALTHWIAEVSQAFHQIHQQTFKRHFEDKSIMVVNVGAVGIGHVEPLRYRQHETRANGGPERAILERRKAYFAADGGDDGDASGGDPSYVSISTRFFDRARLEPGDEIAGPAILEQIDTTTILPPRSVATVDSYGNLIVEVTVAGPIIEEAEIEGSGDTS